MEKFKLTIRTAEAEIFGGEVESIHFDSEGGEMEVFADHASTTASILFSPLVVRETAKQEETFMARSGIFSFDNEKNEALVLAIHCEKESEISKQSAEQYLKFIQKELAEGKELSNFQILYLQGEKVAIEKQIEETQRSGVSG